MPNDHTEIFSSPTLGGVSPVLGEHYVGRYRLLRVIGHGGMGMVYAAQQESPRREVALKVLRDAILSQEQRTRFDREAQLLADLNHPHIANVIEAGTHRVGGVSTPFYAMQLIHDALPITSYAKQADLSSRQRVELFASVCDAIAYAHDRRVLHRDLKPSNILVDGDGRPQVIDFGIAHVISDASRLTTASTSQLMGTIHYMSPEQVDTQTAEPSTAWDVYALGVVLFELVCGAMPYVLADRHPVAAMQLILQAKRKSPLELMPGIDTDLAHVLIQAVHRDPQRRYPSAAALAADLRRYLDGKGVVARADSLTYKAWLPLRRLIRTAPAVAIIAILLITFVIADRLELVMQSSTAGLWLQKQQMRLAAPNRSKPLEHTRIVAVDRDMPAALEFLGIKANSDDPRVGRLVYASLIHQLVKARVRAIVLPIEFPGDSPFEKEFNAAIADAHAHQIPVIAARDRTKPRSLYDRGDGFRTGFLNLESMPNRPLSFDATVFAADMSVDTSLLAEVWASFHPSPASWRRDALNSVAQGQAEPFKLSRVAWDGHQPVADREAIGSFYVELSGAAQLDEATFPMGALDSSGEGLAGKTVIIANRFMENAAKLDQLDAYGVLPSEALAAAIEQLHSSRFVRTSTFYTAGPVVLQALPQLLFAMTLATAIAYGFDHSLLRRVIFQLLALTFLVWIAAVAYRNFGWLLSPLPTLVMLLLPIEAIAAIRRKHPYL